MCRSLEKRRFDCNTIDNIARKSTESGYLSKLEKKLRGKGSNQKQTDEVLVRKKAKIESSSSATNNHRNRASNHAISYNNSIIVIDPINLPSANAM